MYSLRLVVSNHLSSGSIKSHELGESGKMYSLQSVVSFHKNIKSTVGWVMLKLLSLKQDLGLFQSLLINVILRVLRSDFFCVKISTRTIQTKYEKANMMEHDRVAGLRKTANLTCYI